MRRRGFTLLEVLVATAIMAMAVVGLLSSISASVRTADRLTDRDRAALVARRKMDELLVNQHLARGVVYQAPLDAATASGLEGGWRAQVTLFEGPPQLGPGAYVLDRVELEIWWMNGDQHRNFVLEGFRRSVLRAEDLPPGPQL
jgi:general secretion pathway protein I